jgi:hypothetical protein
MRAEEYPMERRLGFGEAIFVVSGVLKIVTG